MPGGLSGATTVSAGGGHSLAIGTIVPGADVTPPVVHVPTGLVLDATGPDGLFLDYQVRVWDGHDPAPSVTCTPVSNSTFAIGETTVTCTAVDASGNSATASFAVHVCGPAEQTAASARHQLDAFINEQAGKAVGVHAVQLLTFRAVRIETVMG